MTRSACFLVCCVALLVGGGAVYFVECQDAGVQNIGSKTSFVQLLQSLMNQQQQQPNTNSFLPSMNRGMNYAFMNQPTNQVPVHMGPQAPLRPNINPMFSHFINQMTQQPALNQPQIYQPQLPQQQQESVAASNYETSTKTASSTTAGGANLFNLDTCGQARPTVTNYVSGGATIDNQEQPWYVQIIIHNTDYTESETYCGGTLITNEWVLTAAHCYDDMRRDKLAHATHLIFRGLHGRRSKLTAKAEAVILHNEYVPALLPWEAEQQGLRPGPFNDLALVRIRIKDFTKNSLDKLMPACLPSPSAVISEGTICKVMGHGFMNSDDEKTFHMPQTLQAANVKISSNRACQDDVESRMIKEKINEKTTCVRGPIHPCVGDSGGPLLCTGTSRRNIDGAEFDEPSDEEVMSDDFKPRKWYLVGVTSFAVSTDGHDTCGTFKSAVFGLVSSHLEWIRNTILNYKSGGHGHGHGNGHGHGHGHGYGHGFGHGQNYYNL